MIEMDQLEAAGNPIIPRTRKLVQKIDPFIRGIEQYQNAFDVLINAKPEILSLIWGGARIILHVSSSHVLSTVL